MDAFFLVDKPLGISSFDVIRKLRKKLNMKKMGHTGTLDPLATGALLVATGNYTKLIPYLEKAKKKYEYRVELNGTTSSGDLAEEVSYISEGAQEKFKKTITAASLKVLIKNKFLGDITQVPPQFSALKIDGKRAYELAREGKEVKMKLRELTVFSHHILGYSYPSLDLEVEVSAGAYVRSLAVDIGAELGTGGYVSKLRRTQIEQLNICEGIDVDQLTPDAIVSVEKLFDSKYYLTDLSSHNLARLNDGLPRIGKFDLELDTPYFVYNGKFITNVVVYDGKELTPVKRITQ